MVEINALRMILLFCILEIRIFVIIDSQLCYFIHFFVDLLDIDRVIKERDITVIEQYIPLAIHYKLEDDQAEILDANFVKIFRISQLAIEYLLFCKKYLDNTVVLLKKEMSKLKQVSGFS